MKLPLLRFADPTLARFYEETRKTFDTLDLVPYLVDGVAIEVPAAAAAGVLTVAHKLQREPVGWFVLYVQIASGATSIPELARRTGERWDTAVMQLYCTQPFEALRLWVF